MEVIYACASIRFFVQVEVYAEWMVDRGFVPYLGCVPNCLRILGFALEIRYDVVRKAVKVGFGMCTKILPFLLIGSRDET